MKALLAVQKVSVHFGGTKAVHEVDLEFEAGRLYGLIGPNGSGKSTLLGAMSRLTRLTAGALVFRGDAYTHLTPEAVARLGVRRTFQTVRLLPEMTVLDNVKLGADARLAGRSIARNWLFPAHTARVEKQGARAAAEAIERLGLTAVAREFPLNLSYGTQRRVEIARALAAQPSVLMLDEPTAGMTREERDEVGSLLRELSADGLTQILVEHDVPLITRVCDHLYVMNAGQLIASGDDPAAVVQRPEVQEAYLGRRAHAVS
ncbi:ABC transporter ATP-binding protein [Dactylosporangium sp. CA-139066]|uniref:ABC transporter ATP-binding protein n=1 Tax=Dactylosporangium sp. CA-139066 TaxID=3239930 RepID=UPI003D8DD458